ncbi:16S rRNA (uracil(1498)-N(3))-methyltransferase [Microbacterium stercoris]|uniref:Ribosomal RNA small subunit methyltransferase E n=1 Tax=Microbacterium stercoris TaxID=2820289 RepID=A0A939QLZ2_9MICO|nr:16S rRNA (uracil(1498)-N(3))-methyltransferase [Microbacterium stercoris]MBO3664152.1 16S rRNA (uracil(1498)-N(3))-methyltransferase [Microbacterium stercoris]
MALHFIDDTAGSVSVGGTLTLTGAEAHHAAAVRRVRVGEAVTVTDGRGTWLEGACESVAPREVVVRISERRTEDAPRPRLTLAQALAKGDRDELAVQAATELGVDEIVPWQAARSVSRWEGPKAEKGRQRWSTIVREAAKQAHRAWLPEVVPVTTTGSLAARAAAERVLVLEPTADVRLSAIDLTGEASIVLVVGPEGGISAEELERFETAGAQRVKLGDTVLRTSTAGPAALALVNARLGRW